MTLTSYSSYVDAVKSSLRGALSNSRLSEEAQRFPPTVQYLRKLCICSSSNLLGRFDLFLQRFGMNTLVANMNKFRQKGGNLDWFLSIVHHPEAGDPPLKTHRDKVQFLCWGSPKARALCKEVLDYTLPLKAGDPMRKTLFGEETVVVAWF